MLKRRNFLKSSIAGLITLRAIPIMASGFQKNNSNLRHCNKVKLKFILASDGHYGQEGTNSEENYNCLIEWVNNEHVKSKIDFVIINGDIVHDKPELLYEVNNNYFKKFKMPYYAVAGNHDFADAALWQNVFGYSDNYSFVNQNIAFIIANTSNIKGEFLCPDYYFLATELEKYKKHEIVFIVLHIPPIKWLPEEFYNAECLEILDLIHQYPNVKAIFHGHDHSVDGVRYYKKLPHIFDGHFGGNWGTVYKGFRIVEIMDNNEIITYQVNPSNHPIINRNTF